MYNSFLPPPNPREEERGELGGEGRGGKRQREGATLRAAHLKLALFKTLVDILCVFLNVSYQRSKQSRSAAY